MSHALCVLRTYITLLTYEANRLKANHGIILWNQSAVQSVATDVNISNAEFNTNWPTISPREEPRFPPREILTERKETNEIQGSREETVRRSFALLQLFLKRQERLQGNINEAVQGWLNLKCPITASSRIKDSSWMGEI